MKRPAFIISAAVVCVIAFIAYLATRTPAGIEAKGGESETVAWVSLATATVSLVATIVGPCRRLSKRDIPLPIAIER